MQKTILSLKPLIFSVLRQKLDLGVCRIFLFRITTLYEVKNRETRPTFFY